MTLQKKGPLSEQLKNEIKRWREKSRSGDMETEEMPVAEMLKHFHGCRIQASALLKDDEYVQLPSGSIVVSPSRYNELREALPWAGPIKPVIRQGCSHEWRTDSWFTAMKYETCTKCGAKKEEL